MQLTIPYNPPVYVDHSATYTIEKDTLIAAKQYQKIKTPSYYNYFDYTGTTVFLRRDTTEKIFFRQDGVNTEYLLYDFGRHLGDTFQISPPNVGGDTLICTILEEDTMYLDRPRKRWRIGYIHYSAVTDIWIEGIGSTEHPLMPGYPFNLTDDFPLYQLQCFTLNASVVYPSFGSAFSCSTTSISARRYTQLSVSPNPTTSNTITLQSETSLPTQSTFQLFDITGRMILQQPVTNKTNTVQLGEVSKGMYLYSVITNRQQITSGKLMVE